MANQKLKEVFFQEIMVYRPILMRALTGILPGININKNDLNSAILFH